MADFNSQKISEMEEKILEFWRGNAIFEKSLSRRAKNKIFSFYDGPPFATGLPHYGHILASIIKDAVPRYQTMKGKLAERRWGWDCHGLPIENLIEGELNLGTKKDIEKFGIDKFNEAARKSVLRYAGEWKRIIPRIGRWVDMDRDYKTMDWQYTESIWRAFKTLSDKKLIYEGHKPMHICPRCETTLANFEVTQGYKDVIDISVYVKFELEDEPNVYLLAWTTTPWTLPGNAALAVGENMEYVSYSAKNDVGKVETYILERSAFNRMKIEAVAGGSLRGKDLIGRKYKPLFDYYAKDKNLNNRENGWKIYGADFVQTEEGTGVVHIAPAFGEDDMKMGKKENLPFIQHVSMSGKFNSEAKDFAGLSVKPRENPQAADVEIIKWLGKENKLFKKEKITHPYPHCWRCDTPLLNYAASSWFVNVEIIKNKLISNNKKINWVPRHIKEGRFGKWLKGARDWAISRSRFWGAPIPVWRCQGGAELSGLGAVKRGKKICGKQIAVGSIGDLKKYAKKSGNRYFVMRHGEAEHNVKNVASANPENRSRLTEKGKKQVASAAKKLIKQLKKNKIDLIFSSDYSRTKETVELMAGYLGIERGNIIFDSRIREVNVGVFDGRPSSEYHRYFSSLEEKFYKTPLGGENLTELKNRTGEFLYEIEKNHSGKNILIVSHEYTIWNMFAGAFGADVKATVKMKEERGDDFIRTGEIIPLNFVPLPHGENYELDLHRPYIDEIELRCSCGGELKRIEEVFDCWFESGSMPFAQSHYPFENKEKFKKTFPAEFIAEGVDQTRGWFYTLLVLSTALFGKPAYKNVIVNGIILAEDGQKMSKRLKNYPDPMEIVSKYGADALRLYLLSSPAVRAEDLNFSEKGVDEVYKKTIMRLWNVLQFYNLYADKHKFNARLETNNIRVNPRESANALDKWILARLDQLIVEITKAMDNYELDKSVRPIGDFVEDLSTWYIRRSRERFKEEGSDKKAAMATTRFILIEFSKAISPFAPFIAEKIYQELGGEGESVHLGEWPGTDSGAKIKNLNLLGVMTETRKICSLGLELRQKAGIKVRQPLASLKIKDLKLNIKGKKEFLDLIKDELNVKEIVFDGEIKDEIELDLKITSGLKAEGQFRELTRAIQDLRKKAGLAPQNRIELIIETGAEGEKLVKEFQAEIKKIANAREIKFAQNKGEEIAVGELKFQVEIKQKSK